MEVLTFLQIIFPCYLCILFLLVKSEKFSSYIPKFWDCLACHLRAVLAYCLSCVIFILPLLWIPIYIYRCFVILIARVTQSNFGSIFKASDAIFVEDCLFKKGPIPKASIVNSVTLEAPIGIEELRRLFNINVIRRAHANGFRYPELRQFPVQFMGYVFWKKDDKFKLEDHVIEQHAKEQNISLIHQEMINKPFTPYKSPWEVVLINKGNKTLVFGRFHHSIIDAKGIIKLFVECLGNQELTMPHAQQIQFGVVDKLLMPLFYIPILADQLFQVLSFCDHPWKSNRAKRKENYNLPHVIRFSPKLSLADIKKVGKASGGTASSVIMAVISGSVKEARSDLGDMSCLYILPKEDHPPTLGNHADGAYAILPTGESEASKRLETCHRIFKKISTSNIKHYLRLIPYMIGTTFEPLKEVIAHELSLCHMGISNIAGESKGFSIGGKGCSEFALSVGTLCGDIIGVAFCVSSYKDHIQIAVISKGGRLTEVESEKLASGMSKELENLKRIYF